MDAAKKSYNIPKFKEQYDNFIGSEFVTAKRCYYLLRTDE